MTRILSIAAAALLATGCATLNYNAPFPDASAKASADRVIDEVWANGTRPDVADFNVRSPEVRRLTESMVARFSDLAPYFASGAVGLTADGYVAVRDPALVPEADRTQVRTLVANETSDRAALYREIAIANGQPQWEPQIRRVFAGRWYARGQQGWWIQNSDGTWGKR